MNASSSEGRPGRASVAPMGRGAVRLLWNSNPFYPISAALVLLGLRSSCDPLAKSFPTWAMLSGLAAYTLLLAGMAVFLVRRASVWDDVRTIVLLVVLVLLAIPAFLDDVLVRDPRLGVACELVGLLFACGVSEAVILGLRLRWPWTLRVPYHLMLALFFLHPVALAPLLRSPDDPALMWALFAFPTLAGAVTLTLLPAARRGARSVERGAAPWRWPLYPWTLFAMIGLAVGIRSYSHCLAVNYSGGTDGYERFDATIFGPYFLIPLGLATAAVVLEIGIAARNRAAVRVALAAPILLAGLAAFGDRPDAVYRRFLMLFADGTGGSPLFLAVVAAAIFYAVAALRRVRGATEALTLAIVILAIVGPRTFDLDGLTPPRAGPLVTAALLQAGIAVARRSIGRGVLATGLATAAVVVGPIGAWDLPTRAFVAAHVATLGILVLGALGRGGLARLLRGLAACLLAVGAVAVPLGFGGDVAGVYPIVPILVALAYAGLVGGRPFYVASAVGAIAWVGISGAQGYAWLRGIVSGLDQIAMGLAAFGVAAAISLFKAGMLPPRRGVRKPVPPVSYAEDLAG